MSDKVKKIKNPLSGRQKYIGVCGICSTADTSRWYRKIIKDKVICKSCYDKHKRTNNEYKKKRDRQRDEWDLKYPYKSFKNMIRRKKITNLTESEYLDLISKPCYYCKRELPKKGIRLDRIKSEIDYLKDNVVPCCRRCNVAKNNMKQDDFIEMCKLIAQNFS